MPYYYHVSPIIFLILSLMGREESSEMNHANYLEEESYRDLQVNDLGTIFNKYENANVDIRRYDKVTPQCGSIVTSAFKYLKSAK